LHRHSSAVCLRPILARPIFPFFPRAYERAHEFPRPQNAGRDLTASIPKVTISGCLRSSDRVLECAVKGQTDYIVMGDRHLLKLGVYHGFFAFAMLDCRKIAGPLCGSLWAATLEWQ